MSDRKAVPVAAMVEHCRRRLEPLLGGRGDCRGLILGCGNGDEVVYLRRVFHSGGVVGVDLNSRFSPLSRAEGCVVRGDAMRLPFPAAAFDFAAAFHLLEHVREPRVALAEVRRVLRPGAPFYAGVPNRTRVLGYLGSFDATLWQKVTWNLTDWRARLLGRFRNEAGAHAGFDREELLALLSEHFTSVECLTGEFLRFKYGGRLPAPLLDLLLSRRLLDYSAPSHYALCRRAA
ncbi:MAG: methyltransferase domain-containing protein [Terriglobia bacterium]